MHVHKYAHSRSQHALNNVWGEHCHMHVVLLPTQYPIRFDFRGVELSRMLAFSDFRIFIFVDGHAMPLHKSPI